MYSDEFSRFAEIEYCQAKKELERLLDLWDDAMWYHSEVSGFQKWKAPWYVSFPGSSVEMYSQNHLKEGKSYAFYYTGTVEDAAPLPPMIVFAELQPARDLCDAKKAQLRAAYDWAPGGARYEGHLQSEGAKAYVLLSDKREKRDDSRDASTGNGTGL
jgi:hypothetical protein